MSKRKGVSAEEKRTRMLQLFYEKKEFFQLKDLEKIAPKEKGIIVNSVKEVLQSLVDDGLVDTDKIGTSVYFWSFPSKATNNRKRKLEETVGKYEEISKRLKTTTAEVEQAKIGKEGNKERDRLLDEIMDLQLERDELVKKCQDYEKNDPKIIQKIKSQLEDVKQAANRWTDNVFSVKSWCKNKFGYEESALDKQFGIPSDFDYL
ncbi:meiotic nuclear division protein 1 [Holotrichia oblita]|uniref:Meiotic nuclear division protein 1 n=1 Tax=Holotrichia oblita TaxID=644536 RepID=A0ACB9SQK5_HOLOL|nr:meiotic nuclear division protein 1 [Holotrichia oblita]